MSHAFSATENSQLQRAINLLIQSENLPVSEDVVDALAPAAVSSGFVPSTGRFSELMRDAPMLTLTAFLAYVGNLSAISTFSLTAVDPPVFVRLQGTKNVSLTASRAAGGPTLVNYNAPFAGNHAAILEYSTDQITWILVHRTNEGDCPEPDPTASLCAAVNGGFPESQIFTYTDRTTPGPSSSTTIYYRFTVNTITGPAVYNIVSLSNCVDRAAPSVQITVPPDGSGQSGAFPVIINAVDDCSLDHIDLYVQDRGKFLLISSQKVYGTGGSIGYTLDTTQRPLMNVNPARPPLNGQHPLAAYAFDAVGNRSDYSLVTFFLRNTVTDPGNALFAIDAGHSNLNSFCQITSVKTDSAGRINVVGIFQGTTNFLGQSISSVGGVTDYDLFVAQISTSGTLNWLNHYGNALENRLAAVTVDSADNVIVIGQSNGDINLGGSTLINPSTLGTSIIVAKYNSAGAHQWSIMHGGVLGGNNGNAVCVDSSNDVYIGGQFHFQADFGGGTRQGNGGESGFVAKYSGADGSYIWDHINLGNSFNSVSAVTTQGTQLFAVGYSFGDIDVGGGNMPALTEQGFAASYNKASGAFNWGRPHAGTGSNVQALGCVMDTTGHLLVTGSYTSGFSIDSISYTQSGISGSGAGYVVRLDTVAGLAIAGFQIGGTSSIGGVASGGPIAVDSAGNIIVGGIATGEVDFGDGQVTGGTGSMWVAKYTPGMLVTWYDRLGGTPTGSAIVKSMAVDGSRNIVLVGGVSGSFSLQGNTVTSVSQQNSDGFVIRYSP